MQRDLLIVGTSGLAKEAAQLARIIDPDAERWGRISYVAESDAQRGRRLLHGTVDYTDGDLGSMSGDVDVVVAVGHPALRRRIAARLRDNERLSFPNLVHPQVDIDGLSVTVGVGNMLTKGVVVTCDIAIGDFNLVGWNSTIGHDASIGSYNVVNPGSNISGWDIIGDACLLGTGCQVLERLTIASDVTIGAGAVVTRSIDVPGTYVGIPARLVT